MASKETKELKDALVDAIDATVKVLKAKGIPATSAAVMGNITLLSADILKQIVEIQGEE